MALLTVESDAPEIEILDKILTESEKDKSGKVVLYKTGKLKGTAKPNPITGGLNEFQVEKIKECVYNIRNVDGAYKFYAAKQLYELRGIIRGSKTGQNPRQWTWFKKSKLVPFSPREIQDLCSSYQWMIDSGIDPSQLNTVGIRTLGKIANTENKGAQARLTARLIGGEQISYEMAREEIDGVTKKQTDVDLEAFLAKEEPKIAKLPQAKLKEKLIALIIENFELKKKQKELRASLMINPNRNSLSS